MMRWRLQGLSLLVLAFLLVPTVDVISKIIIQNLSPGQVSLGRYLVQTVLLLPLAYAFGQLTRPKWLFLVAGLFQCLVSFFINAAVMVMPVANAIAIFFVEPLLLTLLSALILAEPLGWRRLSAVGVGLVGAMIVIRPNWDIFGINAIYPLCAALSFACYMISLRKLSGQKGFLGILLWAGIFAAIFTGAGTLVGTWLDLTLLRLSVPSTGDMWLFLLLGGMATLNNQLIINGLRTVEASAAAPLQYLEIVSATALGWLIFGDFPDGITWMGTAVIVTAGIYVIYRERQIMKHQPIKPAVGKR